MGRNTVSKLGVSPPTTASNAKVDAESLKAVEEQVAEIVKNHDPETAFEELVNAVINSPSEKIKVEAIRKSWGKAVMFCAVLFDVEKNRYGLCQGAMDHCEAKVIKEGKELAPVLEGLYGHMKSHDTWKAYYKVLRTKAGKSSRKVRSKRFDEQRFFGKGALAGIPMADMVMFLQQNGFAVSAAVPPPGLNMNVPVFAPPLPRVE